MEDTLKVGLMQTVPRLGDVRGNLDRLAPWLESELADADVAVAPELALHGYFVGDLAHPPGLRRDSPELAGLGGFGPAVVAGFVEEDGHRAHNSAAVIDGHVVTVQRKLFLPTYRDWEEHKHFSPGHRLRIWNVRGSSTAVLICNDLWQPVLPWLAAHAGAEVLVVIANSVESTAAVDVRLSWELLLRHAAVSLQCYVVFVNRSGDERGRRFWGGSGVIGLDGEWLVHLDDAEGTASAVLDLAALRRYRREWPLLKESRFDLIAAEATRLHQALDEY